MSAFAARRAAPPAETKETPIAHETDLAEQLAGDEGYAYTVRRAKKRRRTQETVTSRRIAPSTNRYDTRSACIPSQDAVPSSIPEVLAPSEEALGHSASNSYNDIDEEVNTDSKEDRSTRSDVEVPAPSASTIQKLCTFVPSGNNVLSESDTEWTIRIGSKDVSQMVHPILIQGLKCADRL